MKSLYYFIALASLGNTLSCSPAKPPVDCNLPPIPQAASPVQHLFRNKNLNETDPGSYLEVHCQSGLRTTDIVTTNNIRARSPNHAVVLYCTERADAEDPLHYDVMDPVRYQLIELTLTKCATPVTTDKIHATGWLPNLVVLRLQDGKNLVIKKRDFARMRKVRMLFFFMTTIDTIEPYTFTDLPHLRSLILEGGIGYELLSFNDRNDPINSYRWSMSILNPGGVEKVRRLHCNCSYAWLRNFLKRQPHLTVPKKEGEIAIIGRYVTPAFASFVGHSLFLSVDCARSLSHQSAYVGTLFSYNTSCYEEC
ncbi:uncharacterized protein LOC129598875 [Paramacrobiotus metropolitanus]|uniref:uncharacterized protein LOC129598875 n=1 Tax=Paramacrobiotus metropolitanus TaxID=2943436 RepID=UPI002445737D|nr:uncharacterized protein LOC129598875 [Paramacrobiotus metropolitanus]